MEKKTEKTKNNKVLVIVLIIVSVLLVGCIGFIIGNSNASKNNDIVEKDNREEKEETVSDDVLLKDDLADKIGMLETISTDDNSSYYRSGTIYAKNIKNEELSVSEKLFVVLERAYWDNYGKSSVTTNYDFGTMGSYGFTQIDVSKVEIAYKKLFGTSLKKSEHQGFNSTCPMFVYDETNQKYYAASECGGTSAYSIETYLNRVTVKGDEAYAYVSLAAIDSEKGIIYTDYARTKQHSTVETIMGKVINKDNYKEFGEYKYTFKKDNNNFYFAKLERLS